MKPAGHVICAEYAHVAPYAGAWIETSQRAADRPPNGSRPTRARGLKPGKADASALTALVAPYAGAWIETSMRWTCYGDSMVAPYAGAWIETMRCHVVSILMVRRALRGRVD